MQAVLLAAGCGTRFGGDRPKCLAEVAGRPILAHALASLAAAGLDGAVLVVGHRAEAITGWLQDHPRLPLPVTVVDNPEYRRGSIHSLHRAIDATTGPVLLVEADLLFDPQIPAGLLADPRPDLVCCTPPRHPRPWLVALEPDGRVGRWGYGLPGATEELVGLYKLSRSALDRLRGFRDMEFWDPLLDLGLPLYCRPCRHAWTEVDTPEDLAAARRLWEGGALNPP